MADLLTLNDLKIALGNDLTDTEDDAKYDRAIRGASAAIRAYARRDFNVTPATGAREYEYDDSGYLDVDDASAVSAVGYVESGLLRPLDATEWRTGPQGSPVITYLRVPAPGRYSPAMGFTRNLDVVHAEGRWTPFPPVIRVTATWGWTTVPDDVRQAAVWTAVAFMDNPRPYQNESVADYSYTAYPMAEAIPKRAQSILDPYVRVAVA